MSADPSVEEARNPGVDPGSTPDAEATPVAGGTPTVRFGGEAVSWELVGGVLEVRLQRAPANEIGTTTLAELEGLVAALYAGAERGEVRAMILHSTIDAGFCAGADLRELYAGITARRADGDPEAAIGAEVRSFIDRIHATFDALDQAPVTTVAAVHGVVFGGGFELALCCDLVVADKSARFAFPELRLGLIPGFGGIPRLRRDVGNAVIRDLLLTGRTLSATRAHELGLASQLVARGEALNVARHVAAQACRFDADVTRAAKRFIKPLPEGELAREKDLFCALFTSPVVSEALRRFTESHDARPYLP